MMIVKSRRPGRRAVAAVEMALVSPLLVLLMLGLWEVGRVVEAQQILSNAAREAARQAATATKTTSEIQLTALTYIQQAGLNNSGVSVTFTDVTTPSVTSPDAALNLDHLKITVTMPTDNVRWLLISQLFTSSTISGTAHLYSMASVPVNVPSTIPSS
jgi:Flp pilus assembly protein TadG